jgi:Na+-driven multidrug efflux pump
MSDANEVDEAEEFVPEAPGQKNWSRKAQRIASVAWPSFLAAIIGSIIFFAYIDPVLLGAAMTPALDLDPLTGYAIVFFLFWLVSLMSSTMTMFLRRTRRRRPGFEDPEPGYDPDKITK